MTPKRGQNPRPSSLLSLGAPSQCTNIRRSARIWREGQTRNVSIVRIVVCGSIEEKILQRQIQKADMASVYFDAKGGKEGGGNGKSAIQISAKELRDVFRIPGDLTKCAAGTVQFVQDRKQKQAAAGSKRQLQASDSESESDDDDDAGKKKMWCGETNSPIALALVDMRQVRSNVAAVDCRRRRQAAR